ncbi:MAG: type II toxin-antitoxin system death-on-curing family toxin, partial [Mesorhizobium sp.]
MTEYHSREFVEAFHAEQLRLHGGAPGIRDEG